MAQIRGKLKADQQWHPLACLKIGSEYILKVATEFGLSLYKVADVDDAAAVKYYGFVDAVGGWYILEEDKSVTPNTYRYVKGDSDYLANWGNRTTQPYDYFYNVF